MKRIVSACFEQTLRFESSSDSENYLRMLNRKHIKYQILNTARDEQGYVIMNIKREYNNYSIGDYFRPDR